MAARDTRNGPARAGGDGQGGNGGFGRAARRLSTETKQFFKTSEWWTYVVVVIALLIAGNSIEGQEGGSDYFAADKVWLYITILTVGYFLSRGLAKAGSRDPYWESQGGSNGSDAGIGDRVKAAAEALREPDGDGRR
jgi:hypothetical protein